MEESVNLYKQNCSDWDLDGKMIYRGSWTSPSIFYGHAGSDEHDARVSANSGNVYTSVFSLSESWNKAPDRSKSYIMSDDIEIANSFTDDQERPSHVMIPYNGTKFGFHPICADIYGVTVIDVLENTNKNHYSLITLDHEVCEFFIENITNTELVSNSGFKNSKMLSKKITPHTLPIYCSEIDKIPKEKLVIKTPGTIFSPEEPIEFAKHWIETNPDSKLLDHLKFLLDFDKLGFKTTTNQSELVNSEDPKRLAIELWSDGEFLGISNDEYDEFRLMCITS
jgi:hypothetical protein